MSSFGSSVLRLPASRVWVVLVVLLVAQAAAFAHLTAHASSDTGAACEICINAAQAGHALPPAALRVEIVPCAAPTCLLVVPTPPFRLHLAAYQSRAPPRLA